MNELQYDEPHDNLNALIATTLFAAALGFLLFRPRRKDLYLQQGANRPKSVDHQRDQLRLSSFIPEQDFALMAPLSATLH